MTPPALPVGDLSCEEIVDATGCPAANVLATWPVVLRAMKAGGVASLRSQIGMAGTIARETLAFKPLRELRASEVRQPKLYALQQRYWPSGYYGRGLIQTSWEYNYRALEAATGLPVLANPDLLLEPEPAATAAVFYWQQRRIAVACDLGDWPKVQKLVNGGMIGWDRFIGVVARLVQRHDPHTTD